MDDRQVDNELSDFIEIMNATQTYEQQEPFYEKAVWDCRTPVELN